MVLAFASNTNMNWTDKLNPIPCLPSIWRWRLSDCGPPALRLEVGHHCRRATPLIFRCRQAVLVRFRCHRQPPVLPSRRRVIIGRQKRVTFKSNLTTGGEVSEILFFSAKSKRRPSLIYSMQIIPVCLSIVARRKGVSATRRGGLNWTPISLLVGHPCKLFHNLRTK